MKLSARNQLKGQIVSIERGAVNAIVTLDVCGTKMTSTISLHAVEDLELTEGCEAYAVVKATDVMIGLGELRLSARNQLKGKITAIEMGAVNAIVAMEVVGGNKVTATISIAAVKDLGLEVGSEAIAVVKATSVMIGR